MIYWFLICLVLHEVQNHDVGDVLFCSGLDGIGATAASESVSKAIPPLFSEELEQASADGHDAIALAFEKEMTSDTYRSLYENG